ncbi:hypothetical protein [Sulfurimonas sp. C5]|uniref:hypothetical protein n=1 Tax=Sulfurimonas sp. C5 TaxID=3036947 RepID=UPI00245432CA|nr:hypothetical protein [Sulfurimonas sp. C5]MDH4943950.1 hypothetical protein [Sulfurimonas sp. C5]
MTPQEIEASLKVQYNRDLRKQIVKSILAHEKNNDKEALQSSYHILNQIFSYVLSELGWSIAEESNKWDETPLEIMAVTFPKLKSTKWYQEQHLFTQKSIKVESEMLQK